MFVNKRLLAFIFSQAFSRVYLSDTGNPSLLKMGQYIFFEIIFSRKNLWQSKNRRKSFYLEFCFITMCYICFAGKVNKYFQLESIYFKNQFIKLVAFTLIDIIKCLTLFLCLNRRMLKGPPLIPQTLINSVLLLS